MKIVTLTENTACRDDLTAEHGLSLYIETGSHKILFDAGQTDAFARNAEKLGVDLRAVDMAVLSHSHYDHGGGLPYFLKLNTKAKVYVNQNAFRLYYHGPQKYIGLDPALKESGRIVLTGDSFKLDEGLTLMTCNEKQRQYPIQGAELSVEENGQLRPDDFCHEQYLLAEEQGKKILFSGCSHKGILNIESWFQPDVLVGGFHFKNLSTDGAGGAALEQAAECLLRFPTDYYTCHCTGTEQYQFLKNTMGNRLRYLSAGTAVCI